MISLATEFIIGSLRSLMPRSVRADSRPTASWAISFGSNKTSPHPSSEWITSDIGYPSMTRVRDGAIPTEMIVIDYDKALPTAAPDDADGVLVDSVVVREEFKSY